MLRLIVTTWVCLGLLAQPTDASARPSDIVSVERLSSLYNQGIREPSKAWLEKVVDVGTAHRVARARVIAKAGGYESLLVVSPQGLEDALRAPIRRLAKNVRDSKSIKTRADLLHEMLIVTTEDGGVHTALAEVMGFPAPGGLVEEKLSKAKIDFAKYASATSETARLAVVSDLIALGAERGGSGAGNGVPDAGEWIQVSLAVTNVSGMPYFSSSAWVTTPSSCAWAPPAREFEFPELPPGGDGFGHLNVWVYLSRTCPDAEPVSLRINVRDTHRARGAGHVLTVKVPVRNRLQHKAVAVKFDRDAPGYSDGREAQVTDAGQSFELSHAVRYNPTSFRKAFMGWGIDADGRRLIHQSEYRTDAPMFRDTASPDRLLPGDDFDLSTVERRTFENRIRELARDHKWVTASDAHVILASDVLLAYEDPQPPPSPRPRPAREQDCEDGVDEDGDGKVDCDDSDCAGEKVCRPPTPPELSDVVSLVRETTRIEAQRTSVTRDDGIDAVNDHYELSFDRVTFAQRYRCLVHAIPMEKCGVQACPSCKRAKPKKAAPQAAPAKRYVSYVHRTYFRVPVRWQPDPGKCDGVRCDRAPAAKCRGTKLISYSSPGRCAESSGQCSYESNTRNCADTGQVCSQGKCQDKKVVVVEPSKPLPPRESRIDVAYHSAAIAAPTVEIEGSELWDTTDAPSSEFELRYSHGFPGLTYFGALAFGSGEIASRASTQIPAGDDTKLSTFSLSLGAGYLWTTTSRRIEVHPRVALAILYRGIEVDESPWIDEGTLSGANMDVAGTGIGLELGSTLRARLTENLAAHFDFAYILQGAGPAWTVPDGGELLLLSGSHSRLGGGITFMF